MARVFHRLSELDEAEREAHCDQCDMRVQAHRDKKTGTWRCTQRPAERHERPNNNPLRHVLSDIDEVRGVATCVLCGFVRIYAAKGARARVGQLWVCGRRVADRGVGGRTQHTLTGINETLRQGVCGVCGPVPLIWRPYTGGGGRWGCYYTRYSVGQMAYKYDENYKRAICPYCGVWHRWDRNQGKLCRERLCTEQEGKCAICGIVSTKPLRVDHDHKTGKTRGGLCSSCNIALGSMRDDPLLLEAAARYIRNHRQAEPP